MRLRSYLSAIVHKLSPYTEGIKWGAIVGLFVSNFLIISNQLETLRQVNDTSQDIKAIAQQIERQGDTAAKDAASRDAKLEAFVLCLFQVVIESNNRAGLIEVSSVNDCQYTTSLFPSSSNQATAAPTQPQTSITQQPSNGSGNGNGNGNGGQTEGFRQDLTRAIQALLKGKF